MLQINDDSANESRGEGGAQDLFCGLIAATAAWRIGRPIIISIVVVSFGAVLIKITPHLCKHFER